MISYANRIRTLREKAGKTQAELADLLGMTDMGYFDLELHDDELSSVPSLAQVKRLAEALGVRTSELLSDHEPATPTNKVPYTELVQRTRAHQAAAGLSQDEFEDQVGWSLSGFYESEQKALESYNIDFLKSLCARVDVPWLEALP